MVLIVFQVCFFFISNSVMCVMSGRNVYCICVTINF